jgi:hypothetical protein
VIISFAWTTAAFKAGRKTCTRRNWNKEYAARFRPGSIHTGYDRNPRFQGKPVGDLQIVREPYPEATKNIPDADFENEGFAFMEERGILIQGMTPRAFFDRWRNSDEVLYVVRFKLVTPDGKGVK